MQNPIGGRESDFDNQQHVYEMYSPQNSQVDPFKGDAVLAEYQQAGKVSVKAKVCVALLFLVLIGAGVATFLFFPRDFEVNVPAPQSKDFDFAVSDSYDLSVNGTLYPVLTNANYVTVKITNVDLKLTRGTSISISVTSNEMVYELAGRSDVQIPVIVASKIEADTLTTITMAAMAAECYSSSETTMQVSGKIKFEHPLKSGDYVLENVSVKIPC